MKSDTFRKLAALGLSHEQMAGVLEAFEGELSARDAVDEDRRAKGRDRWRKWKDGKTANVSKHEQTLANNSRAGDARGDVKQNNLEIPNSKKEDNADKPLSDLAGFKAELSQIVNQERVDAIVAVRRKKKAPISAYSGRLLVKAIKACGDVNFAADEMIVRNWTSIKPEWLEARNSSRATGPPKQESEFTRYQRECTETLERSVYGDRHEQPASNGPAFELEPGDWRSHGKTGSG